jgi:DNA polymerase-3 subunit gamma/tau
VSTEPAPPESAGSARDQNPDTDSNAITPGSWHRILSELDISGMPKQLAGNCELASVAGDQVALRLESASEHLNTPRFAERVQSALSQWLGRPVRLSIELVDATLNTPARIDEQLRSDEMAAARASIDDDPVVRQLIDRVDGAVDENSIVPLTAHHTEN